MSASEAEIEAAVQAIAEVPSPLGTYARAIFPWVAAKPHRKLPAIDCRDADWRSMCRTGEEL